MKIEIKVNISLNEIKELIVDKLEISTDFELYIEGLFVCAKDEFQATQKQAEQPWYPDDSGEWVELPETIELFRRN